MKAAVGVSAALALFCLGLAFSLRIGAMVNPEQTQLGWLSLAAMMGALAFGAYAFYISRWSDLDGGAA